MKVLLGLFLLFSGFCFAGDTNVLFEQLRGTGDNYEVIGAVCEQAAKLDFQKKYPLPRFHIETGISYSRKGNTIGELDVVVFDSDARRVILVGEVKCWGRLEKALSKARDQRIRFLNIVKQDLKSVSMVGTADHRKYDPKEFRGLSEFITISQKGGEAAGFDVSLNYSLEELMSVRERLIKCQAAGDCKKPSMCRNIMLH